MSNITLGREFTLQTEETLILIFGGISALIGSQKPWDYHGQFCVGRAKFELFGRSSVGFV